MAFLWNWVTLNVAGKVPASPPPLLLLEPELELELPLPLELPLLLELPLDPLDPPLLELPLLAPASVLAPLLLPLLPDDELDPLPDEDPDPLPDDEPLPDDDDERPPSPPPTEPSKGVAVSSALLPQADDRATAPAQKPSESKRTDTRLPMSDLLVAK